MRPPKKEGNLTWSLHTPNAIPRETGKKGSPQSTIKRANVKISIFLQALPHLIPTLIWRSMRLAGEQLYLPIFTSQFCLSLTVCLTNKYY